MPPRQAGAAQEPRGDEKQAGVTSAEARGGRRGSGGASGLGLGAQEGTCPRKEPCATTASSTRWWSRREGARGEGTWASLHLGLPAPAPSPAGQTGLKLHRGRTTREGVPPRSPSPGCVTPGRGSGDSACPGGGEGRWPGRGWKQVQVRRGWAFLSAVPRGSEHNSDPESQDRQQREPIPKRGSPTSPRRTKGPTVTPQGEGPWQKAQLRGLHNGVGFQNGPDSRLRWPSPAEELQDRAGRVLSTSRPGAQPCTHHSLQEATGHGGSEDPPGPGVED